MYTFIVKFICPYTGQTKQRNIEYRASSYDKALQGVKEYLATNKNMLDGKVI